METEVKTQTRAGVPPGEFCTETFVPMTLRRWDRPRGPYELRGQNKLPETKGGEWGSCHPYSLVHVPTVPRQVEMGPYSV